MKILFIGDVVAKYGCSAVSKYVPMLKEELGLDFVIVNAENAAYHGMTQEVVNGFYDAGVTGITSGNHMWDNEDIFTFIDIDPRVIRPANYIEDKAGKGYTVVENEKGQKLLLVNVLGRLFMGDEVHNPFTTVEDIISEYKMGEDVQGILVDFHTETTAEKNAMGTFCHGKVSMVVGTHTHMPTADHHVLPGGTAYQTDVGMTGVYDSNIGVDKTVAMKRFAEDWDSQKGYFAAEGEPTLCACLVDVDEKTGLARSIEPVRIGGPLQQTHDYLLSEKDIKAA
jgi:metallophosphoesterase (TIGR00282 family)